MSMTITLWNYSKKHNSTARPDTTGTDVSIVLKQATSFNNPVFILDFGGGLPAYNYVYWSEVGQYYYIDDIVCISNHVFELHCSVDSLATCRPYIFTADAFVKYSTVVYNEYLKDDRIIPTADITTTISNNTFSDINYYEGYTSEYCYLLTTFSETQGLSTYLINMTGLRYLITELIENGDSIIGGTKLIFADAKGSIIDLRTCPITLSALQQQDIVGDSTTEIYLGSYATGQSGYLLDSYKYETSDLLSFDLPEDFTLCEPYTSAKLYLPLVGAIDISLSDLQDASSIKFKFICNLANGNISYILWTGSGSVTSTTNKFIGTYNGNASMELPLSFNQSKNPSGVLTGLASLGASVMGGAFTVGGIAGAVASFSSYFTKSTSVIGAFNGNFATNASNNMALAIIQHGLSEEPENMATLYGRPCGQVLNMADLVNGYVECSQFELQAPYDDYIIQDVNNRMNSGVYLY